MIEDTTIALNMRIAKTFLSLFNLVMENKEVNVGESIDVLDNEGNIVGKVTVKEDVVDIKAKSELGNLEASFNYKKGVLDRKKEEYYTKVKNTVKYSIKDNLDDKVEMKGIVGIDSTFDQMLGYSTICRPVLEYYVDDKLLFLLYFLKGGRTFSLEYVDKDKNGLIIITPLDSGSYLRHKVTSGAFDRNRGGYPYRKSTKICQRDFMDSTYLKAETFTEKNGEVIQASGVTFKKVGDEITEHKLLNTQIGEVMQSLDSEMYEKIKEIRKLLSFEENRSLLDNFIAGSLVNYDEEEIKALFGIEKNNIKYKGKEKKIEQIFFE